VDLRRIGPAAVIWSSTDRTAVDFSTGDGIALATELGAGVVDMDKVQIHSTGWVDPAHPTNPTKILAAELMRGVGGMLINAYGKRFCN
jgi:succinate dehydrogenase/fumarate reductase flavoprotein subunit